MEDIERAEAAAINQARDAEIAARLAQEEEEAAASPPVATAARATVSAEDRIAQLEADLDAANAAINERDQEIADLKLQLEELNAARPEE